MDLELILNRELADCANCQDRKNKYAKWACQNCPDFKIESISPQTWQLLEIRRLRSAGMPIALNDLDYGAWHLLAALEEKIEAMKTSWEKSHDE